MKKLLIAALILCAPYAQAQVGIKADTVKVKKATIGDSTSSAGWPNLAPAGQVYFVNKGTSGIYAITSTGWVRLDSAGTSTAISSDTTINVSLAGITYTIKVDSTVMETIHNSILRSDTTINVVYSATGPDSVKADTTVLATQFDLDSLNMGWFGDGSDGDVTISVNTTLNREMNYRKLTVNTGIILYPDGYRIFVMDTLTLSGTATINDTGAAGANGSAGQSVTAGDGDGSAGAVGAQAAGKTDNYLARWGGGSQNGAGGGNAGGSGNNGIAGTAGSIQTFAIGDSGNWGGKGGSAGNHTGGAGGAGGDTTVIVGLYGRARDFFSQYTNRVLLGGFPGGVAQFRGGGHAGGGGGGAQGGDTSGAGIRNGGAGGGGAGGLNGGTIMIAARVILGSGTITVKGGHGGNGGAGGDASGGSAINFAGSGGGGGAGGTGGILAVFYKFISASITLDYSGGVAGSGGLGGTATGTGSTQGGNGSNGETGTTGLLFRFKL